MVRVGVVVEGKVLEVGSVLFVEEFGDGGIVVGGVFEGFEGIEFFGFFFDFIGFDFFEEFGVVFGVVEDGDVRVVFGCGVD